jgi:methionyl-tRNA formyltransferase
MGARLIVEVLGDIEAYPPVPQPEDGVTYAAKIDKAETRLDFRRSAVEVERQVRAFHPLAYFEVAGERVRVLSAQLLPGEGRGPDSASQTSSLGPRLRGGTVIDEHLTIACHESAIRPILVQRAGRGVMATEELLRGFPIPAGTLL